MAREFIVSGDSHVVEPVDLYKTRLPKNMRDQAPWEEDTILDEPLVPGGHTEFLAKIVGFDDSRKLAPVNPPAPPKVPAPA